MRSILRCFLPLDLHEKHIAVFLLLDLSEKHIAVFFTSRFA